jgi:hypothetical protein
MLHIKIYIDTYDRIGLDLIMRLKERIYGYGIVQLLQGIDNIRHFRYCNS